MYENLDKLILKEKIKETRLIQSLRDYKQYKGKEFIVTSEFRVGSAKMKIGNMSTIEGAAVGLMGVDFVFSNNRLNELFMLMLDLIHIKEGIVFWI